MIPSYFEFCTSENNSSLNGANVEFSIEDDPKTGKPVARNIKILPMNTVKMIEEFKERILGVIIKHDEKGLYIVKALQSGDSYLESLKSLNLVWL